MVGAVIQIHPPPANRKRKPTAPYGSVVFFRFALAYEYTRRRSKRKNPRPADVGFLSDVGYTGFEPVTSALSRQRSKPTELISPLGRRNFVKKPGVRKQGERNLFPNFQIQKKEAC